MLTQNKRVLSGMRPTGKLHLGHYHGALKNWIKLQHEYECFFCVADWHALTTHYQDTHIVAENIWDMVIDWLAVGIDPRSAKIFIQSWVPEHAELHLLLSMITPLGWLERVPSYKEQIEKIKDRDLSTYGFLGYPLLQSADILAYKANYVPVGEDQAAHVELTREIARRFNYFYGKEPGFNELAERAITQLGKKNAALYRKLRKRFQEKGDHEALHTAQAILEAQQTLSLADRDRLLGYLEGGRKIILPEPEALLTDLGRMPGLDGQKMSKSYHNTIALREKPESIEAKVRTMLTDPARVKRTDPGNPEKCPVWYLHEVYSSDEELTWVDKGCRTAGIGCIECKHVLYNGIMRKLKPIQEVAKEYENDLGLVRSIVAEGTEAAKDKARETLKEVREAMCLEEY